MSATPQLQGTSATLTEPGLGAELTLLGGFQLRVGGRVVSLPLPPQRLLAFLALQNRPLLRPYVAGALWPEASESRAAGNLRSALWRLSQTSEPLIVAGRHLQLDPAVGVDVRIGTELALRLRTSSHVDSDDLTAEHLSFDLLPDWYEDWVVLARESFTQLRVHALELLCRQLAAQRHYDAAVQAGLAAVAADSLRESAHRSLIEAYLAEGNAGPALRQYEAFCKVLSDELGLEPSRQLQELAFSIGH
ncbi:MAG: AfsR/SARP family transcriptional regulator [Actinomycetota bacterium]